MSNKNSDEIAQKIVQRFGDSKVSKRALSILLTKGFHGSC